MNSILINHKATEDINISCFGEVLWDCFPDGKRVGGAPLNVCVRLNALGIKGAMISAVGDDQLGHELLAFIDERGVNRNCIAIDTVKSTSTVQVSLNKSGSASYDIVADTAWDNIALTDAIIDLVHCSDVLVFGSLIGRSAVSLGTLTALVDLAKFSVFDVNLRAPHYQLESIVELMKQADFIKLNDDELYEIAKAMGSPFNSLEQNLEFIAVQTHTDYLCVTKGSHGALLSIAGKKYYNSGYLVNVVDTVGAGDSFLGSLLYQLCTDTNPQYAIDFACAVGAMVAQSHGATPLLTLNQIQAFMYPK
ncbi:MULTISPECIES: carbohydrate kinase [Shewanella]|uniref:carbohydrate kinase family protein n=1 Tax=Shewanella TaxID=22 RepID=UPI000C455E87|nr:MULTISPECIES: carbohydrate kinase [Shewanella]NCQ43850.1 carbohydrate kinase [Shewanella frigidimarina]NCO70224.1 carbohydrate kinase [Shewanella vesiculosa]NCP35764.1 carbohydrate kinase [Shewanella vesiculosa]NCP68345.1 carbohydrate kinase [Shewanella vesiculosa]NCP72696.1 carbohydrate kinase [Shewanella vesiculosa]